MKTATRRSEVLLALIFLGFVLAVVLSARSYYASQRSAFEKKAGEQLVAVADLKQSQIVKWLDERTSDARWILASPPVVDTALNYLAGGGASDEEGRMQSMMTAWKKHNRYGRVVLLDSRAQIRLCTPADQSWIGRLASNHLAAVLHTNDVLTTDLHIGDQSRRANMDIFVPLKGPHKEAQGALMFEIDPYDFLFPHIQTWPVRSLTAESLLVRREGGDVLFINELRYRSHSALQMRAPVASGSQMAAVRAVLGEEGVVKAVDYRGVPVLAALRRIPGTAWFLVAKQDMSEVHAPLSDLGLRVGGIGGLLILAASLGIGFLWRSREYEFTRNKLEEHRRTEFVLRASDERYRLLFEHMITGFAVHEAVCDASGKPCDFRFLQANPAFEQLTGLHAPDIIGRRVLEVLPDMENQWIERYSHVAGTGEPVQFEDCNRRLDRHYEIRAFRPEPGKVAAMFHDITERRRAARERENLTQDLKRKNAELEHVIYAASHDLRSPLVNIEGFAKRLEKSCHAIAAQIAGLQLPGDQRPALEDLTSVQIPKSLNFIKLGVSKMNNLIGGLLQLSRLGHVPLLIENLDMNRLLVEVSASLSYQLRQAGASIDLRPLPSCCGDARHINQVFTNLVDNALKYRDPARRLCICITGREENGESIYCVSDTGIGIAPEHQKKIWELFHRLDPSGPVTGDGLGLNLVWRILDRHRGRAWVESTPGEGSRFYVALPSRSKV